MPDLQPSVPAMPAALPALVEMSAPPEDFDYALGCECADPALQIAVWGEEARSLPEGR